MKTFYPILICFAICQGERHRIESGGKTIKSYHESNFKLQFENTGYAVIRLEK